MPDTIMMYREIACSDCDKVGVIVSHWGPIVPLGTIGSYCQECWKKRVEHYNMTGQPLPLPDPKDRGKPLPQDIKKELKKNTSKKPKKKKKEKK
jgi:hypothetical protein